MVGKALTPPDGGDLDNVARALRAHDRQRGLGNPKGAEQIGFDLVARFGFAYFLDRAEQAVAGVVDHDIEPAEPRMRLGDGRVDRWLSVTSSLIAATRSP